MRSLKFFFSHAGRDDLLGSLSKALASADGAKSYKLCSTQVNLPPDVAERLHQWTRGNVDQSNWRADGLEEDSHITVKYGIVEDDPGAVGEVLEGLGSIEATLGGVSLFRTHPDWDVLMVQVWSPGLRQANSLIRRSVECHDTFPTYIPHVRTP